MKSQIAHTSLLGMSAIISFDLIILVVAAAFLGVLANYLKQPTLIAYLLTGIIVGPAFLGFADPTDLIELMAELGLAFLLFLIGLKLDFSEIRHIFRSALEISVLQMILTSSLGFLTAYALGFETTTAIFLGIAFMFSSTAVVIKLLNDTSASSSEYGALDTGILLIQDLAVVLLMVLVASLEQNESIIDSLGPSIAFLIIATLITAIFSLFVLPKLLKIVAEKPIPLLITGIAWLFLFIIAAKFSGISIEIGAFIAGLGLGQVKYSSELKEKMKPLTDFFIALFFINFGLNLSIGEFLFYWEEALILATILVIGKFAIFSGLTRLEGYDNITSFNTGFTMLQTSEFSLIFAAVAASAGFLTGSHVGLVSLVAIITMSISSYFILYHQQISSKIFNENTVDTTHKEHALIIGYEKSLEHIAPLLEEKYSKVILVDKDPKTENKVKKTSFEFIFGDFHHSDLRNRLGLQNAEFIMINLKDESLQEKVIEETEESSLKLFKSATRKKSGEENIAYYDEEELLGSELKDFVENYLNKRLRRKENTEDEKK